MEDEWRGYAVLVSLATREEAEVMASALRADGIDAFASLNNHQGMTWLYTLALGGEVGFANGYGRTSRLPFFQNYYIGGIGSVRGYDNGSLGPLDSNGDALGGTRKLSFSAELLFPFPGMKDNRSLRSSVFFDGGTLWDDKDKSVTASNGARYSTGLALSWLSPVGPMKFSYAFPIGSKETDKLQRFQFTLGQVF